MSQSIPDDLLSDHLFLLVGTNPLPDWVAAQLLLRDREGGQIYLVHSDETAWVANSLLRTLTDQGFRRVSNVPVDSAYSAAAVRKAVGARAEKIGAGVVGLNYTGGTKVMTIHGYSTIKGDLPAGLPPPVFSYLEAAKCVMRFDPLDRRYPQGRERKVGFLPQVARTLKELFFLQGGEWQGELKTEADTKADDAATLLARIHTTKKKFVWRAQIDEIVLDRKRKLKKEEELRRQPFDLVENFPDVLKALTPHDFAGTPTLGDIVDKSGFGFTDAKELAEWLHGKWLEHYVLKILNDRRDEFRLYDCARNVEKERDYWSDKFEVDVAAVRGYQLHVLSCYTGGSGDDGKRNGKLKLFEAYMRAQQLGGEAARAALVYCGDKEELIESEIGALLRGKGQVKVYGAKDLLNLGNRLADWFARGAQ